MTTDLVETARVRVEALVADVVQVLGAGGGSAADLLGVGYYNPERDAIVTGQPTWEGAAVAVLELPMFQERVGREHVRLTCALVRETFPESATLDGWEARFADVWRAFVDELNDPEWHWVAVASLYGVQGVAEPLDAGPFAIVPFQRLRERAPLDMVRSMARHDLGGTPLANVQLVVDVSQPKSSDTFLLTPQEVALAPLRALRALRLAGQGPLQLGRVFMGLRSRVNVSDAGAMSMVGPGLWPGHLVSSPLESLSQATVARATELFAQLHRLETEGYKRAPGNLDLALRSFMLSYDAGPTAQEQRVLHLITAAEALVGSKGGDLTFKMCFRVSGLLAATDDDERVAIFERFKSFYDTRSTAVHGSELLKEKHQLNLAKASDLEDFLRRLLRGWVRLATDDRPEAPQWKALLDYKAIDENFLGDRERQRAGAALGMGPSVP